MKSNRPAATAATLPTRGPLAVRMQQLSELDSVDVETVLDAIDDHLGKLARRRFEEPSNG